MSGEYLIAEYVKNIGEQLKIQNEQMKLMNEMLTNIVAELDEHNKLIKSMVQTVPCGYSELRVRTY